MSKNISERIEINGTTFIKKYVWCGKKNCKRCVEARQTDQTVAPHGPYWYYKAGEWNGKPIWRYVGKNLPTKFCIEGPDFFGRGKIKVLDNTDNPDSQK